MEMRGIDPRTSRMQSEHSTIWATSRYSSSFELASEKIHENQFSIFNELSIPSHYQQLINRIVESSKCFGDAGHRSPYLSHAKRAL